MRVLGGREPPCRRRLPARLRAKGSSGSVPVRAPEPGLAPLPHALPRARHGQTTARLVCDEAPRIEVRIRRDFSFSEAAARELGKRVILLDGAGSFGPLLDNKNLLYNLDHHERL